MAGSRASADGDGDGDGDDFLMNISAMGYRSLDLGEPVYAGVQC